MFKKTLMAALVAATAITAAPTTAQAWFSDDADIAARNLKKAADNFEVLRRIVFINNISNTYLLEIIGYCSINMDELEQQLEVTCMTDDDFKMHFLNLNDTTTYFVEQMRPSRVSRSHYRVTFKPQSIIPDVDFRWDTDDLVTNHSEANPQGGGGN